MPSQTICFHNNSISWEGLQNLGTLRKTYNTCLLIREIISIRHDDERLCDRCGCHWIVDGRQDSGVGGRGQYNASG